MSYDHVLLPSGVAFTPAEVDAYLTTQQGQPESAVVAELAAELNARNAELPESDSFLSVSPLGGAPTGSALQVPSPYDAIGFVRELLFELATPREYAVYDPQLTWLIDPAGHIPVTVTHGGAGEFPYLTERLAADWVRELADPNPYLIVERELEVYIQTYRESEQDYTVEYRDGGSDRHFTALVTGPDAVAGLIWDWAREDRARLDSVPWKRLEL
ncbi:hypothetical protein [Nocardia jinanensis]|uniref:Uncharacterized protein n=1 Tax=Nocardia jinanensis TaxID=382504 RepID=A0A917RVS0_9NOCA|nr:hypothetical protein [Nocardia jinanensis]GGL34119.1 hypothetical protein GCM10011588_56120 [Nocardia jinanensis]